MWRISGFLRFTLGSWLWEYDYAEEGLTTITAALFLVIWQNPQQSDSVTKDWVWLPSKKTEQQQNCDIEVQTNYILIPTTVVSKPETAA